MIVYKITNKANGKVYIGQSVQESTRRISNHKYYLRLGTHFNDHLQRAWNKYGSAQFEFTNIDTAETIEQLNDKEQYWIAFYQSAAPEFGYNKDLGGGNGRMTDASKEKLSQRMLGNQYTKGRKLSEEHRKAFLAAGAENNKNRVYTESTRKKIGDHFRGDKSVFFGKPGMNRKEVIHENTGIKYNSILETAKSLGHCPKSVRAVCDGRLEQVQGNKFKYA